MSIVHFAADEKQLESRYMIPKNTLLETEQFKGEDCRFDTIYDTELQPIKVVDATLLGRPFTTPGSDTMRGAGGVLKLSLETFNEEIFFADLKLDSLRFYLKGQPQHINPLYQLQIYKIFGLNITQLFNFQNIINHLSPLDFLKTICIFYLLLIIQCFLQEHY